MGNLMSMVGGEQEEPAGIEQLFSMSRGLPAETKQSLLSLSSTPGGLDRTAEIAKGIMNAPNPQATIQKLTQKKSQEKTENTTHDKTETGQKNSRFDIDKLNELGDWIRGQPEFTDQVAATKQLEQGLANSRGQSGGGWIQPLSALADAQTGSHLAQTAPNPNAKNESILKYQDEIAKRKGDMMKTIMEGASKLKTGQDSQNQITELKNYFMRQQGDMLGGARGGGAYMSRIPIAAGEYFDKMTKDSTNSIEALNRGDSMLNDLDFPLTYQALNQVQQDLTKGIIGNQQVTDSKTAMDMQHVFAGALQNLKTNYTGKFDPAKDDIRTKVPEVTAQINRGLQKIRGDFMDRVNRDIDQAQLNFAPSYGTIPNLAETVEKKVAAMKQRMPKTEHFNSTGQFHTESTPPKPKNGGKKTDAEIMAMSEPDYQAYKKSLLGQ